MKYSRFALWPRGLSWAVGVFVAVCVNTASAQVHEWTVVLKSGAEFHRIMILGVSHDSLFGDFIGRHGIAIDSIFILRRTKGSYVGEGGALGFLAGAGLGAVLSTGSGSEGGHGFSLAIEPMIPVLGLGVVGCLVGCAVGGSIERDESYTLGDLDVSTRYSLLHKLLLSQ